MAVRTMTAIAAPPRTNASAVTADTTRIASIARTWRLPSVNDRLCDTAAIVRLARDPGDELEHVIDANERGLKNTVRVNPNEIVELAIRFEAYSGR